MNLAAQERAELSRQHLSIRWGPALMRWATARRTAWSTDRNFTPLELQQRINILRAGDVLWDLLKDQGPEILKLDQTICQLAGCREFHRMPSQWQERPPEYTVQELVRRASLELPDIKPARVRHLLARDSRSGRLERTARGRYSRALSDWEFSAPEPYDQYEGSDEDERSEDRYRRSHEQSVEVLLVHYLIQWPAYRKSKALSISDRTYFYRLGYAFHLLSLWCRNVQ
jgi:hypothetical protein